MRQEMTDVKDLPAGEERDARDAFLRRLTKIVSSAIKQCRDAHGQVDAGSVAKRVAAQLWGQTYPEGHNRDLASWVKAVRGQLGLSQVRFAEALGTTQELVSKWENGAHEPGEAYQAKIRTLTWPRPQGGQTRPD